MGVGSYPFCWPAPMRSDEPRAGSTRRSNSGDALRERTWAVAGIDQTSRNGVPRLPAARSSPRSASPIWKGGGPNGERTQSRLMTPQSVYPQMRVPMRGQPPQDSVNTAREVRAYLHPTRAEPSSAGRLRFASKESSCLISHVAVSAVGCICWRARR